MEKKKINKGLKLLEQGKIITNRIHNLGLGERKFETITELLKKLGAIQCQDLNAGKWALGLRIKNASLETIEKSLQTEGIVRTHVLRPTWHFVNKEDIRWMLELTAPRVKQTMALQFKKRGITEEISEKTRKLLRSMLAEQGELTYTEIQEQFAKSAIKVAGMSLQAVLMDAELNQIICNGMDKEGHTTYALFDDRIPVGNTMSQKESVEELFTRYIKSHGPVTIQDGARWTGLPIGDIKKAVQDLQGRREMKIKEEDGYWYVNELPEENIEQSNYLLPRYDEYVNGYKDKGIFLPNYSKKQAELLGNNTIIEQGQIIGTWTRKITKTSVSMDYKYFKPVKDSIKAIITEKAHEYAKFLGKIIEQTE